MSHARNRIGVVRGQPSRITAILTSAALGCLVAAFSANAGTIHPALAARIDALAPGEKVSAILVLTDQAPIRQLSSALSTQGATRRDRHRQVVLALQEAAARSQGPILHRLDQLRSEGGVSGYTPYWIANLVVVHADRSAIIGLAARADICQVEPNPRIELIAPVEITEESPCGSGVDMHRDALGVTTGIRCIQADRVWYEFGVTGQGTIVANLDTGVDGSHPALASRWRGLHRPWHEAWRDVLGTGTTFPTDTQAHGTHVMGTITGLGGPTDSIGVAPGAEWIAANACAQNAGHEFDNDVLDCYQWFADPDGNPDTVDDVPDVVQNSWGVSIHPAYDYAMCDSRFWSAMDNLEAAGAVLIYSAGNSGPEPMTLLSPADRATTPLNAFSVGAIWGQGSFPYPLWARSSRGPSSCPGNPMKPELVAPGVGVRSCIPGGGYWDAWSGTSLAGPHVAGVVALMRSVNPDLEVDQIKQILIDTAVDHGDSGEDNDYGWGVPNAYAAVVSVLTSTAVAEDGMVRRSRLQQNTPNPFTDDTSIRFTLHENSPVRMAIFDTQGRIVRTLLGGTRAAGTHTLEWDGRDDQGRIVPTGIYLYRMETDGFTAERKLLRIR